MRISKGLIILTAAALLLPISTPTFAAEPLKIGAGLLNIGVELREEYTSNYFLGSGEVDVDPAIAYAIPLPEESEWITIVRPEIQFGLPMNDFMLEAHGLAEQTWHKEFEEEDSTSWLVGASLGADFPGGFSFKLGDDYEEGWLPSNQEFGLGEDYSRNEINAYLAFALGDRFLISGEFFNNTYEYDLSKDRNRTENIFTAALFWQFRPRTSAFVDYSQGVYDYDEDALEDTDLAGVVSNDNTARQVSAGVTWEATGKSTGEARIGYAWKEYDEEELLLSGDDRNNESWIAGLDWKYRLSSRTSSVVGVRRGFVESSFFQNPNYVATGINASLAHNFTSKLYTRANIDFDRDTYPNEVPRGTALAEREDDATSLGLAFGFDVLDWLTLEVEGTRNSRDSSFDEFDYDENRVMFFVRAGYGSVQKLMRRSE